MTTDDLLSTAALDTGRDASPRSVTAFFDTEEAADHARRDLVAAGVPEGDVRVAGGQAAAEPPHPHSFWESLKDFFVPDEDRHVYAEGLRRGGFAVAVRTDAAAYDRVLEILDRDGAVDMDERSAGWRGEGWDGLAGPASLGEGEMAYEPAGSATGGFAASRADQPLFDGPMDTAAIEPGSVVPQEPELRHAAAGAPDSASVAAAPGLGSAAPLDEWGKFYAPAGGVPASRADQPLSEGPVGTAAVESGSVVPQELEPHRVAAGAPDTAYAAAMPGLGDTASETSPMPGQIQPAPTLSTPTRDNSHGRTRVRSYLGDELSGTGLPRE